MAPLKNEGSRPPYSRSVHVVVSSEFLGLRSLLGVLAVLVLVGAGLVLEVKVRLGVIEVHGAGQRLGIIGGPVAVLDDLFHRGTGQLGIQLGFLGLCHENIGGLVRVGQGVVVALLGGGEELLQCVGVGGIS